MNNVVRQEIPKLLYKDNITDEIKYLEFLRQEQIDEILGNFNKKKSQKHLLVFVVILIPVYLLIVGFSYSLLELLKVPGNIVVNTILLSFLLAYVITKIIRLLIFKKLKKKVNDINDKRFKNEKNIIKIGDRFEIQRIKIIEKRIKELKGMI